VDRDAGTEISSELAAGEQLIWAGRPGSGLILGARDIFPIAFGLLWTGMVLAAWVSTQRHPQRHNNTDPWPVIALFLAIGLYILFGRYFIDMRRRASTYYAITDERAIILSGTFRRKIKSLNLRTVSDITVSQRRDGTGTISFGGSDHLWFMSGFDF
jgi:hypothetical protein